LSRSRLRSETKPSGEATTIAAASQRFSRRMACIRSCARGGISKRRPWTPNPFAIADKTRSRSWSQLCRFCGTEPAAERWTSAIFLCFVGLMIRPFVRQTGSKSPNSRAGGGSDCKREERSRMRVSSEKEHELFHVNEKFIWRIVREIELFR
jgi:hypothetical protein